jgi:glycosyltransferase involved in cell wall biosynthesis
MSKLALNFICKNESHVIEKMLNSAKGIIDLIVVNDTGSTDGTQDIIKKFGEENNIPTYVFDRPFDDFEKSRNHAMQKLRDVVKELNWDPDKVHGFWFDCDETLVIDPKFNKNQFTKDLYMINTYIGQMKYTRNTFFRVSKPFRWYGPVHEFIVCDDNKITSGLAENIHVDVKMEGSSWKGNIPAKYKSHAFVLEKYIDENRQDPRWIFYTAQSWHDSASIPDNREENEERLRRALKYYKERTQRLDGYAEEIYYSQYRIGAIMRMMEEPWNLTKQELLKAYAMDPLRGESIKIIIDHYLQVGEWHMAYLYSKFCKVNFHGKNPYPKRLLFVDESLYTWKFAEAHAAACFYTGRMDEARATYNEIVNLTKTHPHAFTPDDLAKIEANGQFFKQVPPAKNSK